MNGNGHGGKSTVNNNKVSVVIPPAGSKSSNSASSLEGRVEEIGIGTYDGGLERDLGEAVVSSDVLALDSSRDSCVPLFLSLYLHLGMN